MNILLQTTAMPRRPSHPAVGTRPSSQVCPKPHVTRGCPSAGWDPSCTCACGPWPATFHGSGATPQLASPHTISAHQPVPLPWCVILLWTPCCMGKSIPLTGSPWLGQCRGPRGWPRMPQAHFGQQLGATPQLHFQNCSLP